MLTQMRFVNVRMCTNTRVYAIRDIKKWNVERDGMSAGERFISANINRNRKIFMFIDQKKKKKTPIYLYTVQYTQNYTHIRTHNTHDTIDSLLGG